MTKKTSTPQQHVAAQKPSFALHDKVIEGLNMIFGSTRESVKISDSNVLEMLRIIPITPNAISLLSGIMGTGKTSYAKAFVKVFFGPDELGMIKCDPDKTPHETLYGTDVASETKFNYDTGGKVESTREEFIFDPEALSFVTRPIKFANEISRSSKAVQDALLGLFQEGEIEYRGKVFRTERPFIALLDQNPMHLQGMGARELEPALIDRIDVSINVPTSGIFDDLAIQQSKESEHQLKQLLDYSTMKEVFTDVEKVRKPIGLKFITVVISQSLRACKYKKDISSPIFIESIDCATCEYKNDICSSIEAPIGHRHIESILKFAASRAWLNKREEITIEDIIVVMPFVLSHRLKLKAKAFMEADSTYTWIKENALPYIVKQLTIYQEMLEEYSKTLDGSKDALLSVTRKSKDNLLYQQMIRRISEQLLNQGSRELDALEQTLMNLKSPTRTELDSLMTGPSLKISKMVSSLTEKELNDIESQTERLSKYELGEKMSGGSNSGKDRKEITYQRINPFIKNINSLRQRHDKVKDVIKKALGNTKFEMELPESEFLNKVFPVIVTRLDKDKMLEFGQNKINTITQNIGNARIEMRRQKSNSLLKVNMGKLMTITLTIEAESQAELTEARELVGI
ncbi:MAG: AAA family ATPase (plasmid) [Candidatus Methanoperedens sp.]|nr:MAG: AAA family ATPase [Candidatus Methanoperedens sp.]